MTTEQKINIDMVFSLIYKNEKYIDTDNYVKVQSILGIVVGTLNISVDDLKSVKRDRELVDARKIYIYIVYKSTAYSIPSAYIGSFINRKHPNVVYCIKNAHQLIDRDKSFCYKLYKCLRAFNDNYLIDSSFDNIPQL